MATTEKVTGKVTEAAEKKVQEMEAAKVARSVEAREAPVEADALTEDDLPTDLEGMENTGLVVERRKVASTKKKGEKIWIYFVSGILRNREVQAGLLATDVGGYSLLDLVFDGTTEVPLWRKPYEMTNDAGKVTSSGYQYFAVSVDDDGTVYSAQVKPSAKSDKSFLETLINKELQRSKEGDRVASEG